MSVHKTDRGTWLASVRYTTWDGKRKQKKKEGFKTRREALAWQEEFLLRSAGSCDMKLSEMADIYLEDCKKRLRPSTVTPQASRFKHHIIPRLGNMSVNSVTPSIIRDWQYSLIESGLSPVYMRHLYADLSSLFNFAIRLYGLKANPVKQCGCVIPQAEKRMDIWTVDEFKKFCTYVDKEKYRVPLELLFWCGLRRGEMFALTLNDFDFDTKQVSITKTLHQADGKYVFGETKTRKGNRRVPVPDFLLDHIKHYVTRLPDYTPEDRLFPFTALPLTRTLAAAAEQAGLKRIRLHDLRHSYASMLIEQGCAPLLIADLMGHENVQTTLETYSHLYPNKHEEVLNILDKLH